MKENKLTNLKAFSDSDINSDAERQFTEQELQGYFDKKRKKKYAERLDTDFEIRKKNEKPDNQKREPKSKGPFLLLALFGILLVFSAYYFFRSADATDVEDEPKSEMLFAYKDELYTPVDINVRGDLTPQQQLISALTKAYESKDFAGVITEYQKLKSSAAPLDLNVEQMSGIAFGSLEDYDQAITIFKGILETPESTYSNHATVRYLLGLVYLLQDDKASAKEILQKIKSGDYKYDEVQSILETL